MTRKLILLNLALLGVIALLGWQFRREWLQARARQQALLRHKTKPVPAHAMAALPKVTPFDAAAFADVAQDNLFSKDRNPNVVVDPPPPIPEKPVPAFPVARGVMLWPGTPATIVLSDKPGAEQKGYHPGDTIGEWKILDIDNKYVTFGWDGKEFKKRIDELLDRTPIEVASAPPAPAAPAQNASLAPPPKSGPGGVDLGGGARSCVTNDGTPSGTVVDGMRKVVTPTPFGSSCHWEPVK